LGSRLAAAPTDDGFPVRGILLLWAVLARACGDDMVYRDLVYWHRAMAKSRGFDGHIAIAEAI
jgi:adenylate cyclase